MVAAVIGLVWLRPGFPERWVVDVTIWFDAFRDWAIQNRATSPLFIYFLTPIEEGIDRLVDATVMALERMTWLGLTRGGVPRIAGRAGRLEMALLTAAGVLTFGLLGVWDASLETLALVRRRRCRSRWRSACRSASGRGGRPQVERVLRPILDAMQTIPAYAYLLPARAAVRHREPARADGHR